MSALEKMSELAESLVFVAGDIVECGVYNGRSLAALARALPDRRVWAYDSFEGFPEPGPMDPEEAHTRVGTTVGSVGAVRAALRSAGVEDENVVIRKGWFKDTFKQEPLPEKIAFLSIDCDWYESVYQTLDTMYDRVADRGIVTIDDWAYFEGSRKAVYDWAVANKTYPCLWSFGHCQVYWVKGQESVR